MTLSYWEQQSLVRYQYGVIGGGLVGLSTALSIRALDPKASIVVLERGVLPTGASTRNAGFACFGSLSELLNDMDTLGEARAAQLVIDRWEGLQLLRSRIGDKELGFEHHGGYELITDFNFHLMDQINRVNNLLHPIFDDEVFSRDDRLVEKFGFSKQQIKTVVSNPLEGQLNTGSMMKALMRFAGQQGITVLTGASVQKIQQENGDVGLEVLSNEKESIRFLVDKAAICTNAFARQFLPDFDINPGRGIVLITKPVEGLKLRGAFHFDQGYYYFRDLDSRVLLGGGRNLDIEGEATLELGMNQHIYNHLISMLSEIILPDSEFEVDCHWSGIMAFGADKRPLIGSHSPDVAYAVRLGGMGVSMATTVADRLARILCFDEID